MIRLLSRPHCDTTINIQVQRSGREELVDQPLHPGKAVWLQLLFLVI
jgi:hypothetical protein